MQNEYMKQEFHTLPIKRVDRLTKDAVAISFDVPESLKKRFVYKPGQFVTLELHLDNQSFRRSYSLCSSPLDADITIAVKRVPGGKVSGYLVDKVSQGMTLNVLPPQGKFILPVAFDHRKTYYFFAGGSGITPIMSMIKTVLEEEPQSKLYLLYASRHKKETIFHDELEALRRKYQHQLSVRYAYSKSSQMAGMLASISGMFLDEPPFGRLDANTLVNYMETVPAPYPDIHYYICGPDGLMQMIETFLANRADGTIHTESFTNVPNVSDEQKPEQEGALDTIELVTTLDGVTFSTELAPGEAILDNLLKEGKKPPYACCAGACSSCIAKLKKGEVSMAVQTGLELEEIDQGYILTCQAKALTSQIEISYDE